MVQSIKNSKTHIRIQISLDTHKAILVRNDKQTLEDQNDIVFSR